MNPRVLLPLLAVGLLLAAWLWASPSTEAPWRAELQKRLERLDAESPGELGVYVEHLSEGHLDYQAEGPWYLASTVKLPVAIAVLQGVDEGRLSLDQAVELTAEDKVDGSGGTVWSEVGTTFSIRTLLEEMLRESDNTAADMLIRLVGVDTLNASLERYGFGQLTSLLQVRQDLYAELHPDARNLSNQQIVEVAAAPIGPERVQALANALGLTPEQLEQDDLDKAYDRYYAQGRNSSSLTGYGALLRDLVHGELLSDASQQLLYQLTGLNQYEAYRLEAGLAEDLPFIQKTGTQQGRACHVGVARPETPEQALIIIACAADLDENREAGALFERIGEAIQQTVLQPRAG
ncbi:MAG: class A beta-lactamase-related serine hydrolase [Gammaproteobacteria bacterium]|nr:class A beta-lactamase-related serine hydrolase [Gammaproteobacteria bacterium]MBU1492124.1 class A beta-lactamase-related serine hydrolase [Gammaproteobacteria bacterium]MBU2067330.1 class A beta-lactamase-related serine hydrolase [Gammaproteobacteria bacterium]MBU2158472.1 class A beta-lactamase-related serine hydrolase [Gammaproteobacteria bacterium]MBU2216855.1 class A beta-lactamase-related serine hydrolase [Gammaproteobacteria bacterium]